jgi:deazaflavin-dependent oxidoreductase (nitroreductase family)
MTSTVPAGTSWRLARATSPMTALLAGRRWFPLWAIVRHRGRKSGRQLAVPVAIVTTPDGFIINLPWGAGTNWVRNVLAAGGCTLRWKGAEHPAGRPRIVDATAARPYYSRLTWAIAQRLFPADSWLLLDRVTSGTPRS